MPKPLTISLSAAQDNELRRVRDIDPHPYMRERAAALLKIAGGHSGRAVALTLGLKPRQEDTIYSWVHRYEIEGIAGLRMKPGRGRKPAFFPSIPQPRSRPRGRAAEGE